MVVWCQTNTIPDDAVVATGSTFKVKFGVSKCYEVFMFYLKKLNSILNYLIMITIIYIQITIITFM